MKFDYAVFVTIHQYDVPLHVQAGSRLATDADTAVVVGEAPDGLPLVLHVKRRHSVAPAVLSALGQSNQGALPNEVARALTALEQAVESEAPKEGIGRASIGRVYCTKATMGTLFGNTLLARMFGPQSPLILKEDWYKPSSQPEMVANTAAGFIPEPPSADTPVSTAARSLATSSHLLVPVKSGQVHVVRLDNGESLANVPLAPIILEDLRGLPQSCFVYTRPGDLERREGSLLDEEAYAEAIRGAASLAWTVTQNDVGQALVSLAHNVQAMHDEERVHGDLKPGNVLLTREGARPIDPLAVAVGHVSPGATPGWAAPEQILARPVSPATDVFALGLLALRLVGGAVYGEERAYVIPTGGSQRRRVKLLAKPEVFLDPAIGLDEPLRRGWSSFLATCVAFEAESRPASGGEFARRLEELLEGQELPGRLSFPGGPGTLVRSVEILGAFRPSWVMTDYR